MTGAQALVYARSRHAPDDFDRGARQQRVLTSLREQADIANLIPRIPELLAAVKATVRTDIPQAELAKLAGLAGSVDTKNIRSYVFSYPRYGTAVRSELARLQVPARRRQDPGRRRERVQGRSRSSRTRATALGEEGASIWVLNGSGRQGQATNVAAYLEYYGLTRVGAEPEARRDSGRRTRIVVYNGAETRLTATIAFLETLFETKVVLEDRSGGRASTSSSRRPSRPPT